MLYHDLTISAAGTIQSRRQHDSRQLVREAVQVFADLLATRGDHFARVSVHPTFPAIALSWDAVGGTALATFWAGAQLATTSLLLARDDPATQQRFQGLLMQALRQTAIEPGHELLSVRERPVILSVPWPVPARAREDVGIIADMETCLAAAFFEGVGP